MAHRGGTKKWHEYSAAADPDAGAPHEDIMIRLGGAMRLEPNDSWAVQGAPLLQLRHLSSAIILSSRSRQLSGKSTYVSEGLRECSPAAHMFPFSQLLPVISSNTVKMLIGWPGVT